MAFSFGNLSTFTDELSFDLISKAVLTTDLMENIQVRTGLQAGTVALNLFNATVDVQNQTCGWTTAGTASFSQVDICIRDKAVKQSLCPQDLRAYWLSQRMTGGAHQESVPFEQVIANHYVEQIKNYNEGFLINGDGTCDGIKAQISTASVVATASWTSTTALGLAQDMFDAINQSVQDREDLILILSPSRYNILVRALVLANYFHYDSVQGKTIVDIPGTTMKAVKSSGLVGSNYMAAGPAEFIIAGTGLTDDMSSMRFFYDEGQDTVKLLAKWRLGVAVAFPDYFSTNGLA